MSRRLSLEDLSVSPRKGRNIHLRHSVGSELLAPTENASLPKSSRCQLFLCCNGRWDDLRKCTFRRSWPRAGINFGSSHTCFRARGLLGQDLSAWRCRLSGMNFSCLSLSQYDICGQPKPWSHQVAPLPAILLRQTQLQLDD